jgi:hypothetical protein
LHQNRASFHKKMNQHDMSKNFVQEERWDIFRRRRGTAGMP